MTQKEIEIKNNGSSNVMSQQMRQTSMQTSKLDKISSKNNTTTSKVATETPDLVCLSHLRWNFVFQRPQHLLTRCTQGRRVFFIEEPMFSTDPVGRLDVTQHKSGVWVVVPYLQEGLSPDAIASAQKVLLDSLFAEHNIDQYICWYYTPMAMSFTQHLKPLAVVYDCMDELSAFKGASPALKEYEAELFRRADLVYTGGQSLYEAKRNQHPNVYAFPSSVDVPHFAAARNITSDPEDQANIPHPRLGFYGVIDERMDLELIDGIAQSRPDWHLVMIGQLSKSTQQPYHNGKISIILAVKIIKNCLPI